MLRRHPTTLLTIHWSKDFVEHLRTVHFALIAVSVGLILILSRSDSSALAEIRQIIDLKNEWPLQALDNPSDMIEAFRLPGKSQQIDWKSDKFVTVRVRGADSKGHTVRLVFPTPNWYFPEGSIAQFPETLTAFGSWWGALRGKHVFDVPDAIYLRGEERREVDRDSSMPVVGVDSGSSATAASLQLDLSEVPWDDPDEIPNVQYKAVVSSDLSYWIYVARVRRASLDQSAIVRVVNRRGWNWRVGTFEKSFAGLAREASGLEIENLEQVEKVLAQRLANRSEEFEAFGMKFPIAQVTVWGTVILLGVQLYFFLYLKQLSGKLGPDDPGWDIPWICLDQSLFGLGLFLATVIVLPVTAMLLIGGRTTLRLTISYRAPDSWQFLVPVGDWDRVVLLQIVAYVLASITALVLGISCWCYRPRLGQAEKERCRAELFE